MEGLYQENKAIYQIRRASGRLGWQLRQETAGWVHEEWEMEEAKGLRTQAIHPGGCLSSFCGTGRGKQGRFSQLQEGERVVL